MARILFVDDEPAILDGLRSLLHRFRKRWELEFVSSAAAALADLRVRPASVVISALRMPGMDGAGLLSIVRTEFPQTIRIIFSAQADREAVTRCLPLAHQFIAKPCDPALLVRILERLVGLQASVDAGRLQAMFAGLERIPSPPASYWKITQALADPATGLDRVGELVAEDPAVSAKLLQVVNSAYFGTGRNVTSVVRAVTYLGADVVRSLATASHVLCALETVPNLTPGTRAVFAETQLRAPRVARLAQKILGGPDGSEAYTGGLLHDIGKLILAVAWPREVDELGAAPPGPGALGRETERFGISHAQAGAHLLGLWGIPEAVVDAVACHHAPASASASSGGDRLGPAGAVHLAAALSEEILDGPGAETVTDLAWLSHLGLTGKLPEWRALAAREFGARGPASS